MPRKKCQLLVRLNYLREKYMPCEYCNFYTNSETGMKLHRKSRHGVTTKFDKDSIVYDLYCTGCKKKIDDCVCRKK